MANPVDYFTSMQSSKGWAVILESFARFAAPSPNARVLDVGTGPGALVKMFRETYTADAYGVDNDPAMGQQAVKLQDMTVFVSGSLPHLPFARHTFDMVTATNVLYLLDDPQAALNDIGRVLKVGGTLVMLNPSIHMSIRTATALAQERGLTGFEYENFLHWGEVAEQNYRWSVSDVDTLFTRAGLSLRETRERIGPGLALYAQGVKI